MKIRTVLVLWTVALLLGVSVFTLKKSQGNQQKSATERTAGETLIPDFPAGKTTNMKISGVDQIVTLNKKDDNWVVSQRDDFPADTRKINNLLRSLKDLKVTQGIEAGPSFAPRFGMSKKSSDPEKRGITVSFSDESGSELAKLSFGKNLDATAASSSFGGGGSTGRYIRNHADKSGFYAVSELFSSLSIDPKEWLADEFFKIEKIKTISLTQAGSGELEWTLIRENEDSGFEFSDAFPGVKADPAAVAPLKNLFSYARFDDVVPQKEVEKLKNSEKIQTATVTTFEGLEYQISLQPKNPAEDSADAESYLLSIKVTGNLPEQRTKLDNENPEIAAAADKAFEERYSSLTESLEQTRDLAGITFEVSKFTVDALLKSRTELMDKGPGPQNSVTQPQSGASAFTPAIQIPAQPIKNNNAPAEE